MTDAAGDASVTTTISCPFCAEQIQALAKKCKHCNELLDPALRKADEALRASQSAAPVYMNAGGSAAAVAATPVVLQRRLFGHGIHIIMTILTCGLWIPIWIIAYVCRNKALYY